MVVLGLRPECCHLSHGRTTTNGADMDTKGIARINGYEILAVVPSVFTATHGLPDRWYLVGQDTRGDAVCATTYDLTNREHWVSGDYFLNRPGMEPGTAFRQAYQRALRKAGTEVLFGTGL